MRPLLPLILFACKGGSPADDTGSPALDPPGEEVASSLSRDMSPDVDAATLAAHTASMRAFAFDLIHQVAGGDNLFTSPLSITSALAMTYAGAQGDTETQMASAMHFDLPEPALHQANNALDLALTGRQDEVDPDEGGVPFQLSIVNQLFGQTGYPFEADFLDTLALNYGAGLRLWDFVTDAEGGRLAINGWVEDVTEERIKDLLPPGSLSSNTKLVLVNAIYFKASWTVPFAKSLTEEEAFTTLAGASVTVPTMHGAVESAYGEGDGYAIADVPFVGDQLVMTVLVPEAGRFEEIRAAMNQETWDAAVDGMGEYEVVLALPRFSFSSAIELSSTLLALGMTDAFDPMVADFSGMSTASDLYISAVYHQAFIAVDEIGAEAAAATAVVMEDSAAPESRTLTVDRPFLFSIRDRPTGALLFLGQVVDPSG